jgi:hypothetical protein
VGDLIEGPNQIERGLVGVVEPLAGDLAVQLGDPCDRSAMCCRPLVGLHLAERLERALSLGEGLRAAFSVARVRKVSAGVGGQEVGDAHVDSGGAAGNRKRLSRDVVARQDDVPALALALDADCFDPAREWPVLMYSDVPDAL